MGKRIAALLLVASVAPAQHLTFPDAQPSAELEGDKTYKGLSKAKRPYWYRLPEKIDRPDLILIFHGTGMDYRWGFYNYGVHEGHFRRNDIVISAESEQPDRGFIQGKPDRDDVVALIRQFRKTWPIRHVYLYGHSQGAFFCYYFAGEKPELIDGIVAHAGNFFKAKTNRKARDKVAIGILHGRADAVVTVSCAYMTDTVYHDAGYTKVKRWAVDGLTKQSGHWPLPFHVQRMLAWCDLESMKSAADGVRLVKSEAARENPDTVVLAQAAVRARALGADGMDAVVTAAKANASDLMKADPKSYGPWVIQLQLAQTAFAGLPEWEEAIKPLAGTIKKHTKQIDKAMKSIRKGGKKGFAGGLKAMQKAYAGGGYTDFLDFMQHRYNKPEGFATAEQRDEFAALKKERSPDDRDGRKSFEEHTKPLAAALK
ncbi:MAG: alpha/beta fold hydrolase [Planctomycetota bacterium]|jgi:poly(3-hydroxybutyrate) depolymerase